MNQEKYKPVAEIAYEIIKENKAPIVFLELYNKICEIKEFSESEKASKAGYVFSELSLDGRFFRLENNCWDLSSKYKTELTQNNDEDIVYKDMDEESIDNDDRDPEEIDSFSKDDESNNDEGDEEDDSDNNERDEAN